MISKEELVEEKRLSQDEVFERLHSKELKNISKNLTEEEQKDVCFVVSSKIMTAELERREILAVALLKEVADAIATQYDKNMGLIAMENLITELRDILRIERTDENGKY